MDYYSFYESVGTEGVKLSRVTNRCIITILLLTLSLNGSMAQFGSKVESGDVDVGRHLASFLPEGPSLGYHDFIGDGYTEDDIVYLYMDNLTKVVQVGDVRLTPFNAYPAGSKVKNDDIDHDYPLNQMSGPDCGIYFLDLYSPSDYDLQDPVYILAKANSSSIEGTKTTIDDIRLTEFRGLAPGTRVLNSHYDLGMGATKMIAPFFTLKPGAGNMATIRFFNRDGNVDTLGKPIYDPVDDVYLDISLPDWLPNGFVVPNDLRLSG